MRIFPETRERKSKKEPTAVSSKEFFRKGLTIPLSVYIIKANKGETGMGG